MNLDNPRPVCLLAFFNQQLPSFIREKEDPKEQVEKARLLFEKERASIEQPAWGKEYLKMIRMEE